MRTYTESEHRAAEDRIKIDMDRLDLVGGGQGRAPEDVQADAGSGLAIFLVCLVLAGLCLLARCGVVRGFGDDLRQWSDGIRSSVQSDDPAR